MSDLTTLSPHTGTAARMARFLEALNRHAIRPVQRWRLRRLAIAELEALDDHQLRDIGLTRGEIPYLFDRLEERRLGVDESVEAVVPGRAA